MSQPNPNYVDGYASAERRTTVIPDVELPFENYPTPDTRARILKQRYDVQPRFFTPKISVRTSWTNYLLYSETFANAAWTKTNITNTDAQYANPNDGQVTMALGFETVTNAEHAYQQAITFAAVPTTLSWVVRPNGRTWFRLKANDGTTDFTAFFNLTGNGYVGATSNCAAAVSFLEEGVWRISITFTPAAAAGNVYLNYATDGSTVSYAGNTALGAYHWGAQVVRASSQGPVIITTDASRTVSSPNLDDQDLFAYLVWERAPLNYASTVAGVERKFARIPAPQTSFPGSRYFSLPVITNDLDGLSSLPVTAYPINQALGNGFYNAAGAVYTESGQKLYGPTKAAGARAAGYATAGTFTITFGANTTAALNWNDSGATIAAAINGLASVVSAGLTCTVSNDLANTAGGVLTITWTVGSTLTPVTFNGGSLTQTTANHPTTQVVNSANQVCRLADQVTVTGHGFNTSLDLAVVRSTDSILVITTGSWGSVDSNTLWVPTNQGVGPYIYFGPFFKTYVAGGTYLLRTKEIETFYLPGVSTGITTVADITSPLGLQNPADMIAAIMSLTGFQTYQSEGPRAWEGTLIYSVKSVQINLDDFA